MSDLVGRRLGRYEIVSLLGAGGMGEVYRAPDTQLGREVGVTELGASLPGWGAAALAPRRVHTAATASVFTTADQRVLLAATDVEGGINPRVVNTATRSPPLGLFDPEQPPGRIIPGGGCETRYE